MALAIFDLDNTLIAGDSDHAWGEFLIKKSLVDQEHFKKTNDRFYQDYLDGKLDIDAYIEFAIEPLTRFSDELLAELQQEFMQHHIEPIMLPRAAELLEDHRQKGDYLLIITATNRFVTAPIAKLLEVDDLIATNPEKIDGRYTGKIRGVPSYKEGKVVRLNEWLKEKKMHLEGSVFYSDSHNDIPLLEQVERAVAVDPDEMLEQYANRKGWEVISLRG
ncbi:MAG: HAD-IB family hydrolase [Pseudomonadales bacterium]|nr:HAD-IB family hydrolase [Pseudomonadales bacterium]